MKKQLVFYILIISSLKISPAQMGGVYFRDITTENGLPSNHVLCIAQDSQGFMWFGTGGGLCRYDGYNFKIYLHDPNDLESISWSGIQSVLEDSKGTLWIGTGERGLNRFDREKEKFIRYGSDKNDSTSLSHDELLETLYEDKQGRLWIGTMYGLNLYNAESDNFTRYTHNNNDTNSISPGAISCIYEDNRNNFWVGTGSHGLELFDRETGKAVHFRHNPEDPNSIRDNNIKSLFEDSEGGLWIGTGSGYDRLIYSEDKIIFKHVRFRKGILSKCKTKKALDLYERRGSQKLTIAHHSTDFVDRQGNIWIGTRYEGIKLYTSRDAFHTYKYEYSDPDGLKNRSVNAICETSDGNLWIGVSRGGLHHYDRKKKTFTYVPLDPQVPGNPFVESIYAIEEDCYGDLWIGTWRKGVYKFEKKSGKSIHYMPEKNNPASLNSDLAISIFEDSRQNIWIGTSGDGVYLYSRKNNSFSQITIVDKNDAIFDPTDYSNEVGQIYEDSKENLWFCTEGGLYLYDRDNKMVKIWVHDKYDSTTASSLLIRFIFEDSKSNLWIGTKWGLNLYNPQDNTFSLYETNEKNSFIYIRGLLEDNKGNLWISTDKGISKFNPENKTFKNYDVNDGLQGNNFNVNVCTKLKTGEFVFGGSNGFTLFHPDSIKDFKTIPPVVITDFQIFNKPVKPGDKNSPLQRSISLTDEIILPYHQHSISFEFAVLDYINPKRNQYKYILEGFNKDWIEKNADHRIATYTNLHPGTYVFRVIGSNSKRMWNNEGDSVRIIITPPWWETTLAYILYLLLIGLLIWLIWKTQLRRVHMRHELKMKQFEADKLHELDEMKSRFFANISHEIRTPLTLILGPLDQLISEASKEKWKKEMQIMARNGRNLLHLINQLLDFSKLESGRMSLKAKEVNIIPLLKGMVYSFDSLAKRKQITLSFKSEEKIIPVYVDTDKLEKIMANLLSNACKFTPNGGSITVTVNTDSNVIPAHLAAEQAKAGIHGKDWIPQQVNREADPPLGAMRDDNSKILQIIISDTGVGIAPEHVNHIFDRYYQSDDNKEQTGTGIGLSLTKELVELHHGHISVQSEPGKGSTFIIHFISGKAHLNNDEIIDDDREDVSQIEFIQEEIESISAEMNKPKDKAKTPQEKTDLPILLIVEDTEDVRNYIKGFMENQYQIEEAKDGKQGFDKAIEIIPDIIISDVMMPEMDGFQLCEKLKSDERTSHIPVILLTARASEASKLEGLETGADDYLIKPFNSKELITRVKNLIEQRRKLREWFIHDSNFSLKDITVTSADERFLNRAMEIIEQKMSDPEFGVDTFSKDIGLSHSQLHRKIRALTNQSPVEFIRILRLKRAANLLDQEFGNVAEIAYEVGFNNPSYFAECFRKLFGKSPSEYAK